MRSRIRRLAAVVSLTSALLLAVVPASQAQDASGEPSPAATPSAFCAVLTAQEVTDAVGIDVAISAPDSSDSNCTYQADFNTGAFFLLDVRIDDGTIQDYKDFFPEVTEVTVGGREAILSEDATLLFIGLDNGILTLQIVGSVGEGVDQAAAIQALGELAVPRTADIPLPSPEPEPSDLPLPSFTGDADLAARFPSEIGGQPLEVLTLTADELFASGGDEEALAALEEALGGLGKTMADVSIGFAYSASGVQVNAIRIRGADAAQAFDQLGAVLNSDLEDPQETTVEIAGKQVTKVTDGPEADATDVRYLYPSGDVIWQIVGEESAVSEVFGALP